MTDHERFEILRGEPIRERMSPDRIPCREESDAEKLCKHPVVSVAMLAFKHEKFIAQAIESIVNQRTDFEYELIISEDASPDRTREIAFDYQKKYPDKIRVLWSEKNLNHCAGNGIRLWSRCRGEFVALCEGDDYWLDPLKLQKQVEVMRKYPQVSFCFSSAKYTEMDSEVLRDSDFVEKKFAEGVISGAEFIAKEPWLITCTVMYRRMIYELAERQFAPFRWRLCMRDKVLWFGLALLGDAYCSYERMGAYRNHSGGATKLHTYEVLRDSRLVISYYASVAPRKFRWGAMSYARQSVLNRARYVSTKSPWKVRKAEVEKLTGNPDLCRYLVSLSGRLGVAMLYMGFPFITYMKIRLKLRKWWVRCHKRRK